MATATMSGCRSATCRTPGTCVRLRSRVLQQRRGAGRPDHPRDGAPGSAVRDARRHRARLEARPRGRVPASRSTWATACGAWTSRSSSSTHAGCWDPTRRTSTATRSTRTTSASWPTPAARRPSRPSWRCTWATATWRRAGCWRTASGPSISHRRRHLHRWRHVQRDARVPRGRARDGQPACARRAAGARPAAADDDRRAGVRDAPGRPGRGLEDRIGSLTPGKEADLILIDTDGWAQAHEQPRGAAVMAAHPATSTRCGSRAGGSRRTAGCSGSTWQPSDGWWTPRATTCSGRRARTSAATGCRARTRRRPRTDRPARSARHDPHHRPASRGRQRQRLGPFGAGSTATSWASSWCSATATRAARGSTRTRTSTGCTCGSGCSAAARTSSSSSSTTSRRPRPTTARINDTGQDAPVLPGPGHRGGLRGAVASAAWPSTARPSTSTPGPWPAAPSPTSTTPMASCSRSSRTADEPVSRSRTPQRRCIALAG